MGSSAAEFVPSKGSEAIDTDAELQVRPTSPLKDLA
jgi:hypothetical protein